MTIHLPEEIENSVLSEVDNGHFPSVDAAIVEAWRSFMQQRGKLRHPSDSGASDTRQEQAGPIGGSGDLSLDSGSVVPSSTFKPIWERVLERTADISNEEWEKLPVDLAEQHDHYLYGTSKRPKV